jgi:hypothetical protein
MEDLDVRLPLLDEVADGLVDLTCGLVPAIDLRHLSGGHGRRGRAG